MKKLKFGLSYDRSIYQLLVYTPKYPSQHIRENTKHMFVAVLFKIAKICKQHRSLSEDGLIQSCFM